MKASTFNTHTVEVKWSHLHAPDDKFGADSSNHNITIVVDDEMQRKLDEVQQETGANKVNGLQEKDGVKLLKVKSKAFVKKNVHTFPCRDAKAQRTDAVPFGGDKVILRLSPAVLTRDTSLSLYLNGCQIIEKNDRDDGGFEPTEGFDGSNYEAPIAKESSDEEVPF